MTSIKLLPMLLASVLLSSCLNIAGEWGADETLRVTSPDGALEAVMAEGSSGATTPTEYLVFIVPAGRAFDADAVDFERSRAVVRASKLTNAELIWRGPRQLSLRYAEVKDIASETDWRGHSEGHQESVTIQLERIAGESVPIPRPG